MAIESKLDKIIDDITEIKVTVAKQEVTLDMQHGSLKEHMRRTELLELDVAPIKRHVAMIHGGLKLVGGLAVLLGMVEGIFKLINR